MELRNIILYSITGFTHYHTLDAVGLNPLMGMMLCSSMHALEKVFTCARELWQNNALALQLWCLWNALTLQILAFSHQNFNTCALFCHGSSAKVKKLPKVRWDRKFQNEFVISNLCYIRVVNMINYKENHTLYCKIVNIVTLFGY